MYPHGHHMFVVQRSAVAMVTIVHMWLPHGWLPPTADLPFFVNSGCQI